MKHVRQSALADFGVAALRTNDLGALLHEACLQVARALEVPIAKVAIRQPHASDLTLEAAVGIPADLAQPGVTMIPGGKGSAMGFTLEAGGPVISVIASEARFEVSELVRRTGVRVSANVVLWVHGEAFGSLEADSKDDWQPGDQEVNFLQSYGNLVAAAIERNLLHSRIETLANERQILLNETFHRIKNMLANVHAIARRTAKHSRTLEEFIAAFTGRIGALSRVHDLLLLAPDKPALLRELFELEFEAKGLLEGKQFRLSGPDTACSPRAIQALALLVFELSTNAVKYGALSEQSATSGRIDVNWRIDDGSDRKEVTLTWRETGVQVPPHPEKRGFGSEVIERIVPSMLQGTAQVTLHDDGIECVITFPGSEELDTPAVPLHAKFG